jgi:stringent starvation protein B
MDIAQMTPRRPYLLRAFYQWLVENELTPHVVVDATLPGVRVPVEFIENGQIILNIIPRAVANLQISNDAITFNARFGGRPHSVIVPIYSVQAIYARENGAGTMFEDEEAYATLIEQCHEEEQSPAVPLRSLKTVSSEESDSSTEAAEGATASVSRTDEDGLSDDDEPPPTKGKPSLRVIK